MTVTSLDSSHDIDSDRQRRTGVQANPNLSAAAHVTLH
jgi:hypothetical protein